MFIVGVLVVLVAFLCVSAFISAASGGNKLQEQSKLLEKSGDYYNGAKVVHSFDPNNPIYPKSIMVRGKPYFQFVEEIKKMKAEKRHKEAIVLLLEIVECVEKHSKSTGEAVPPFYYKELGIIYRKEKELEKASEIMDRYKKVSLGEKKYEEMKAVNKLLDHNKEWGLAVSVNGKHYSDWADKIKELKKEKKHGEAVELLLLCVEATEREQELQGGDFGVMPTLYKDLAIIYRKEKNKSKEIEILERFKSRIEGKDIRYKQKITNELFDRLEKLKENV